MTFIKKSSIFLSFSKKNVYLHNKTEYYTNAWAIYYKWTHHGYPLFAIGDRVRAGL